MVEEVSNAAASPAKGTKKKAVVPKKTGPSLRERIIEAVSESKERSGVSLPALKKSLLAGGYDIDRNKIRIRTTVRLLVAQGVLLQFKGNGASGSFKINKSEKPAAKKPAAKKPAAKKASDPKAKKAVVKKTSAAKKPVAKAKKAPAPVAKKSPKKAKKLAPKKVAKAPKKVAKSPKKAVKKTAPAKKTPVKKTAKKVAKKAAPKKK